MPPGEERQPDREHDVIARIRDHLADEECEADPDEDRPAHPRTIPMAAEDRERGSVPGRLGG